MEEIVLKLISFETCFKKIQMKCVLPSKISNNQIIHQKIATLNAL